MSIPSPRRRSMASQCIHAATFAMLAILALSRAVHAQSADDPFASLVAAERAFAADALRIGITPAFRAHAANDSILIDPDPVAAPDRLARQVDAPDVRLEWQPAMAGIARSGDLGFTTGPYRLVRPDRVLHGQFLTIWSRGPDGRWRWFLDHGLPPRAETGPAVLPTTVRRLTGTMAMARFDNARQGLEATEQALNTGYLEEGMPALLRLLADDGYLLRPRNAAITRADAPNLAPDPRRFVSAERLGTRISAAGDLAASYGRLISDTGAAAYYVRVWRRNGTVWQLLIDEFI